MEVNNNPDLFTGSQRQDLINELVQEMKKDSVKQDVTKKLRTVNRVSAFCQHPTIMLIIGFTITGIVGGLVANRWQRNEWDRQREIQAQDWERQQLRLIDMRGIDLKYKLIDEVTKSIGERNAAAIGILTPLLQELSNEQLMKELEEPKRNWQKADYDWRANSQILQMKIGQQINNPQATEIFKRIMAKESEIGATITILRTDFQESNTEDNDAEYQSVINGIKQTGQDLSRLAAVIIEEARLELRK